MVRKVIYALLVTTLALVAGPARALADETEPVQPVQSTPDYSTRLDTLSGDVERLRQTVEGQRSEIVTHLITMETLMTPLPEPVETVEKKEEKSEETKQLEKIGEQLESIQKELTPEVVEVEEQKPVSATKATVTFTAYGNANPTNQYAQYSIGLLPRLGYGEHYIYLQDTSSSYVFVYGDLRRTDTNSYSGNAKYVRWYYVNNVNGYVQENGSGNVIVSTAGHVVMSDLEDRPMLAVGSELIRREVGFYALTACSIFCLASVLGFCVRLRGAVSV